MRRGRRRVASAPAGPPAPTRRTRTGTVGAVGAFSFNGNKIVTTGGGGMIVTDDDELARRARHLTTQAKVPDVGYLHDEVGYNYRLTNLAAALGLAQLERLDEFVAAKRAHRRALRRRVRDRPLTLPPRVAGTESTYWLYSVLARRTSPPRRTARAPRRRAGSTRGRCGGRCTCSRRSPAYARLGGAVGDDLFDRGLSLPCSTDLTDADQERVIAATRQFLAG